MNILMYLRKFLEIKPLKVQKDNIKPIVIIFIIYNINNKSKKRNKYIQQLFLFIKINMT